MGGREEGARESEGKGNQFLWTFESCPAAIVARTYCTRQQSKETDTQEKPNHLSVGAIRASLTPFTQTKPPPALAPGASSRYATK